MPKEDRCEKTELLKSSCSHCRGLDEEYLDRIYAYISRRLILYRGWVLATYNGRCGECNEAIYLGRTAIKWTEICTKGVYTRTYWRGQCCATEKELELAGV